MSVDSNDLTIKRQNNMDIRSVTLFCEPTTDLAIMRQFFTAARHVFSVPVQSTRLATTPFPDWLGGKQGIAIDDADLVTTAQALASQWQTAGANYIGLGPVQLRHDKRWLDLIPVLLSATDVLFATAEIADTQNQIDVGRCQQMAAVIKQVSTILPNGFGNLYLTAVANCPPGSPFLPVAYHGGGAPAFAIAVEAADLALQAIQAAQTLDEARTNLVTAIEMAAQDLTSTAVALAQQHNIQFGGIDFSLAPYPTPDKSLAGAMEAFGIPHVGASGSLFTAAFITEAIGRAKFSRCGFSGLMLTVLEDSVLATRAAEGVLTAQDLLSYAAVCGVGLDTVPLPGDVDERQLTAVLLDIAALATRLNKPLTARLMPLPGLQVGDPVTFDFPYFADSRVMSIKGSGVSHLLEQPTRLTLYKRAGNG